MNKDFALGIDIGGSHLAIAIVDIANKNIISDTKVHVNIDSKQQALPILTTITNSIKTCIQNFDHPILGIGISIPGPLDYENGISKIYKCNKYDHLFGVNIKSYLFDHLREFVDSPSNIVFTNDANCFLLGEAWRNSLNGGRVAAVTLGTGIGSGFMADDNIVSDAEDVPPGGEVFRLPYKGKRAEDWLGTNWFLEAYSKEFGIEINNVKAIAEEAETSPAAKNIFNTFGLNLGTFLSPLLKDFEADHLVIGGSIAKSYALFSSSFVACFNKTLPNIIVSGNTEDSAILGAVQRLIGQGDDRLQNGRHTKQYLMPIKEEAGKEDEGYQIFPSFKIDEGSIQQGYKSLAQEIAAFKSVVIDGYVGVYWDDFIFQLTQELQALGVNSISYSTSAAFKDPEEIDTMIAPFLGGDDPVFGKLFHGTLLDFFDGEKLNSIKRTPAVLSILYGPGAALCKEDSKVIYLDVPKNEIQYRSRSGGILNLGAKDPIPPKPQYKRMFFIDWVVLNKHKAQLTKGMDYFVDTQYLNDITWSKGTTIRQGLEEMSKNAFRVRPWFEAGVWGGHWMKDKINGLSQDVANYAWSFELIVPENGIVFSKNGVRLEVSFDLLMFYNNQAVLGDAAKTFGYDFPIRFDYLDTFDGANLSLQCHPTQHYIREHFGEKFTQDETYYILDAKPGAQVYLGFKEGAEKEEFHRALVASNSEEKPMDIDKYIQKHTANKHDLFLIPNGTIHCSGKDNLVLEISSTPYIYTFKMYDWMRLDLDGSPRPLNIERGMENVNFECKGAVVKEEYISKESSVASGRDWEILKLNTHAKHFYEVHRFEFQDTMEIKTHNQCHILNLVEGSKIKVVTGDRTIIIHFAETFVVPADTRTYTIQNLGDNKAKVIQSNVKPEFCSTGFL
ncbi:ROK family protein [Spongiimicrobium sp. 3-5]|uniref:ROK family protein n=1 Tax=Spongiimicrobium sp. 3-5 TaxID=3332596 RepID=UPI003980287C